MRIAVSHRPAFATVRDLVSLTKPRITGMVIVTGAGGMFLERRSVPASTVIAALLGLVVLVSAANVLNCWLERDTDRYMRRTASRPLPAGRLDPRLALAFGAGLAALAVPMLTWFANPLTGFLGAVALVLYVAVYTPLKQKSANALLVGAIPGAMPPLMGSTTVANDLTGAGLALFGILFIWQVPHFIAISSFRRDDYERAGHKILPSEQGDDAARRQAMLYAAALLPVTLFLVLIGAAGAFFTAAASALGLAFFAITLRWTRVGGNDLARRVFFASIVYLPALLLTLTVDAAIR